ncbi:DNA repair exonuclease [Candidatus Halobeggiatoa sp. HSG11]|nr:DNA repair exonuclease [Candidatus Halobeggiatoa sp. HSG11]
MKFIHAADIHLDSPLRGLSRYDGVPIEQMQSATRRSFIKMVDFACSELVDFILLAGDLYDADWKDYNTGLFFNQQMTRLRQVNIPVFIIMGNHDADSVITKQLRLPENVFKFSYKQPETHKLEDLKVAIHGQSFAKKSVTDNLSMAYPKAVPNYFNIGLLHTAVNGRPGHAEYAPCNMSDLLAHDYDYWALGHIHKREVLHENPWIVFSGNLQGRHVRETGMKGCTLVTVENEQTSLRFVPVDVLRWEVIHLNISDIETIDEIIDKVREAVNKLMQEDIPQALRFVIEGSCTVHNELHNSSKYWINEIRSTVTDVSLGNIWVEKVKLQTQAVRSISTQDEGPLAELGNFFNDLPQNEEELQILLTELRFLKNAVPTDINQDSLSESETICKSLGYVEELLMARLQDKIGGI